MNLSRFYAIGQIEYCRNFIFKRNFPIHKIFERGCEIALVSALRFGDPRVQALFAVLVIFSLQPQGFRNKDLRPLLAQALDLENQQITQGKMSCDLRRLTSPRINRMNRRIPYQPSSMSSLSINVCRLSPTFSFAPLGNTSASLFFRGTSRHFRFSDRNLSKIFQ